ncbi:TetR/AcrR family transcriptional regulator [Schlesneria sp.]|uniref:TetR/AcrR family transcriptional regulator n=1 Tax=Schlesneria sp. TaxID=2762018 RepID=UPI002F060BA7
MKKSSQKSPQQKPSSDSANTRELLLEVAGQIFAEKGFDRTTSKEITLKAGTNIAAVNYHFGGIEGLYAAVLEEAGILRISSADLRAAVDGQPDAEAKLKAFLRLFIQAMTSPAASSWRLRVLIREFAAPTVTDQSAHNKDLAQKMSVLKGIVSEVTGLPEDHPAVARGCINVLSPCFLLAICDRPTLKRAYPQFGLQPEDAPALIQHMTLFALAGLAAVARDAN